MIRDSIFISYSHKDIKWLNDSKVKTGSNWQEEILQSIKKCKVAILLVSNNFLASEFILKKELPGILKSTKHEGLIIFNIIMQRLII